VSGLRCVSREMSMASAEVRVSQKKYRLWLGYLISILYGGWFLWAASSNQHVEALSRYIPGWFATLIWALWPILLPIGQGPLDIPVYFRVSLYVSYLISGMFFPVALRFYPFAATFIGCIIMVEYYWVIPRWKKKWNRDLEPK
jgi:hypothetical protein